MMITTPTTSRNGGGRVRALGPSSIFTHEAPPIHILMAPPESPIHVRMLAAKAV